MRSKILVAIAVTVLAGVMLAQTTGSTPSSSTTATPTQQTPPQVEVRTPSQIEAQTSTGAASNSSANASGSAQGAIAAGAAINAELTRTLDSRKAKENDPVQAKVVQDVVVGGKVVVPRNSKLIGHVTDVKAGGKGQPSSMGIAFDKAVLKNGQEVPVHAVIQALAPAPRQPMNAPGYDDSGSAMSTGSMPSPQSGGYNTTGGGGMAPTPVGGAAGSATAGAANGVGTAATNTAATAAGAATNTAGMTTNGQLTGASRGVMGMPGLTLEAGAGNSTNGSVISNQKNNVKLDSGTQVVLRVTTQ
jgi:hypothetical protein